MHDVKESSVLTQISVIMMSAVIEQSYCMNNICRYYKVEDEHTCVKSEKEVTRLLLCYVWDWVAEWRWREKEAEAEEEIVLSYDERLDWLESDDCSKWPGRWLHLCFPFSLSLLPSFPHSLAFSLTPLSLPPCLSLSPPLPGFIMAAHQQSASLSPNGTAISTNAFQTYSSCHITIWWKVHVFLQSLQSLSFLSSNLVSLFQCVALRVNLPSISDSGRRL